MEQGDRARRSGRIEAALAHFEEAIRDAPEDVEARMRAAEACMDLAGPATATTRGTKSALAQTLRLLGARQHLDRAAALAASQQWQGLAPSLRTLEQRLESMELRAAADADEVDQRARHRDELLSIVDDPASYADPDVHLAVLDLLIEQGAYDEAAEHTRQCLGVFGSRLAWARTLEHQWRAVLRVADVRVPTLLVAFEVAMASADAAAASALQRLASSDADDQGTVEDYEATLRQWWERVVAHIGLHGASTDLQTAERIREEYHARVFVHYATWQLRRLAALVRAPANAVESDVDAPDFVRIGAAAQTAVLSLRMACCFEPAKRTDVSSPLVQRLRDGAEARLAYVVPRLVALLGVFSYDALDGMPLDQAAFQRPPPAPGSRGNGGDGGGGGGGGNEEWAHLPTALRRFLELGSVDTLAVPRVGHAPLPDRLQRLLALAHGRWPAWAATAIQERPWSLASVLDAIQFVAARDRSLVTEAMRRLFPSAPPTGSGWTWSALERWLWILLIQRCEATAMTELHDVLALVHADMDVQRLRQVLPGVWQPSRLQQRLWVSLLHRYGGPTHRAQNPLGSAVLSTSELERAASELNGGEDGHGVCDVEDAVTMHAFVAAVTQLSPLLDAPATQAVRRDAVATVHRLLRIPADAGAVNATAEPYIVLASLSCTADPLLDVLPDEVRNPPPATVVPTAAQSPSPSPSPSRTRPGAAAPAGDMAPPALTANELVEDVATEAAPATPVRRLDHERPAAAPEDVESTVRRRNRHADRLVEANSDLRQLFGTPGPLPPSAAKPAAAAAKPAAAVIPSTPSIPAAPSSLAGTPSMRSAVSSDDEAGDDAGDNAGDDAGEGEVEEEPVDVNALAAARQQRRGAALRALLQQPFGDEGAPPLPAPAPTLTTRAPAEASGHEKGADDDDDDDDDGDGWEPASDEDDASATTPPARVRSRGGNAARSPSSPGQTPSPVRTSPSLAFARRQRLAAKLAELRR